MVTTFTAKNNVFVSSLMPPNLIYLVHLVLFIYRLYCLDLGPIAYLLIYPNEGKGWSMEQTSQAIVNYKRFLLEHYLEPDTDLRPSKLVDQVWHVHILDTQKYLEDCNWLFGYLVHHFPYG